MCCSVEGLHAIVVSDRDGVPVIKGNFSLSPATKVLVEQQGVEKYSGIPGCRNCFLAL